LYILFIHLIETSPQKTIPVPAVTHHVQSGAVNGMTSPLKVGASNGVTAPTTEDRYSALKDLDALFTNTQTTPISEPSVSATPNWNSTWNTGTAQAVNVAAPPTHQHHSESVFSSNGVDTSVAWSSFTPSNSNPSNPFLGK
jgi:hypothetical protein